MKTAVRSVTGVYCGRGKSRYTGALSNGRGKADITPRSITGEENAGTKRKNRSDEADTRKRLVGTVFYCGFTRGFRVGAAEREIYTGRRSSVSPAHIDAASLTAAGGEQSPRILASSFSAASLPYSDMG